MESTACWTSQRLWFLSILDFLPAKLCTGDSLVNGHILANAAKFALQCNPGWFEGTGWQRVEGSSALGSGVVMVILGPWSAALLFGMLKIYSR